MKNKRMILATGTLLIALGMFVGCGGQAGEKEYEKALKAWRQGDLVQARTLLEKATTRLSGDARKSSAYNDLGLVLWKLDEPNEAAQAFSSACDLSESVTHARLNLARALFQSGDIDNARISLRMFTGEFPEDKDALALQSLIAAEKRDWAQSVRVMSDAVEKDPDDPAARNALVLAELNHDQDSAQAIRKLQLIISRNPDYAPAVYNLAMIYDQWENDASKAVTAYRNYISKADEAAPHVETAKQAIARMTQTGGSTNVGAEAAANYFREGARLLNEKKFAESITAFSQAVNADPRHKNSYYNMALAYYSLRKFNDSASAARGALRIDSGFADARYMLVLSYVQLKNWDAAEREAKTLQGVDSTRGSEMLDYISKSRN
ncbi:MAG: tetratricopeptide repeat protein [Pontiellaceae bacterium]|nr:tetratricopeptide repeat protein [Pontiellaceae bacterium]MBN2786048.1 tetratricopeptide repeat protein [Pontiellaceae bacterium]